jgi:hypothetical protein
MNDNESFENIKYGNIYINIIPKIIPLGLWSYFIYKYYYTYYKKTTNYSFIFLLILCLPFLIILGEIVINKDILLNTKILAKPNAWHPCLTLFTEKDQKKETKKDTEKDSGVLGIYSYDCGANQVDFTQSMMKLLQYKFYYLNFTLFLLILIYHKFVGLITTNRNFENIHVIFISLALFLGTLGVLPCSFGYFYTWSLMAGMMFSTILNMNIAAFLIILYALLHNHSI